MDDFGDGGTDAKRSCAGLDECDFLGGSGGHDV